MPNEKGEITKEEFDYSGFFADVFKAGRNIVSDGERGGGKTHTAIAIAEMMMSRRFPFDRFPKTFLLTNVIFMRKDGESEDDYVEDTPEDVFHITSMEDMFRIMSDLYEKNGRDILFLVVLDEAQNYLLADSNSEETNQNFLRLYGMTRKFNMCLWTLTPAISNLPPRARNFADHPDKAGYVTARLYKDKAVAMTYIKRWHSDTNWKQWVTIKLNTAHKPTNPLFIPVTPWTMRPEDVKIGGYFYDTGACADFRTSISDDPKEKFDFRGFINACSDVSSFKLPTVMKRFFDGMDSTPEQKKRTDVDEQMERIVRLREHKVKWEAIADSEIDVKTGKFVVKTTWQSRFEAYMKKHPELSPAVDDEDDVKDSDTVAEPEKPTSEQATEENEVPFSETASSIKNENGSAGGRVRVYIDRDGNVHYIPEGVEGSFSDLYGKDMPNATEKSPCERIQIPDGRYTKREFDRAAEYCLEDEP